MRFVCPVSPFVGKLQNGIARSAAEKNFLDISTVN